MPVEIKGNSKRQRLDEVLSQNGMTDNEKNGHTTQNAHETGTNGAQNSNRDNDRRRQAQEQVATLHDQSQNAIAALARVGVNGINAQMFEFDSRLSRFEEDAALAMADRMRQSSTRIAMRLAQELSAPAQNSKGFGDVIGEVLEVPDLSTAWLSIAPSAIAGCLPM